MALFRDLIVWQKAHQNLLNVLKLIDHLPNQRAAWEVGRQLVRSAGSIGANIAEGHGRQLVRSRVADYRNFFEIALGSSAETDNWLQVIHDAKWVTDEQVNPLMISNTEVMKMLYALIEYQCSNSVLASRV